MFEQLAQLVLQYGQHDVVDNAAVPNEHNNAVMNEASTSILASLKNVASKSGGMEILAGLFQGNNASNASNPVVSEITDKLSESLGEKFGLDGAAASGVASSLIPKVLGALINGAKDPNNNSIQMNDIIAAISGGSANSGGLMDMISKYGSAVGLDQNGDGNVDVADAIKAISNKSGSAGGIIGGLFSKIFGK